MNSETPYKNLIELDQEAAKFIQRMLDLTNEIESNSTNKKAKYRAYLKGVALQKEVTAMVLGFKPMEEFINLKNSIVEVIGKYDREIQKDIIALIYQTGANRKTSPCPEVE